MAITSAICSSAKLGWLEGLYLAADSYKIALYTSGASLDATTTAYTTSNEVSGTGYTAGGEALSGYNATLSGTTAILQWSNPFWTSATITAAGCLIYDVTASNAAICVISFGGNITSTNGTFTIQMPTYDASNALIRFT